MSATLEHEKFSKFFGCNVFHIPGRTFPVDVNYLDTIGTKDVGTTGHASKSVEIAMRLHCTKGTGDILIFLTGRDEIEKACKDLYYRSEKLDYRHEVACNEIDALLILPMYGSMSTDEQRRVFRQAPPGVRKVVLATDIASTSLTIDGIVFVVDSGFVKQKVFNPNTGLDALRVVPISRSEASQRAGRAGRTKPGECYRLVSKEFEDMHMLDFTPPEIQRTSLTSVVLTLKSLGIKDVLKFNYLDPPEERMLLEALRELSYFDALDANGDVTVLGKKMGSFPLPPHLSRVVLFAGENGCADPILKIVAMLSVEQMFMRPGSKDKQELATECHAQLLSAGSDDFTNLLLLYDLCDTVGNPRAWCRDNFIHFRAMGGARRTKEQLEQILNSKYIQNNNSNSNNSNNNNDNDDDNNNNNNNSNSNSNNSNNNNDNDDDDNNNSSTNSTVEAENNNDATTGSRKRNKGDGGDSKREAKKIKSKHKDGNDDKQRVKTTEAIEEYHDWISALTTLHVDNRVQGIGLPVNTIVMIRQALCYGYFNNVARRSSSSFSTMDGHATCVSIHPASFMFDVQHKLDWIMYHEVVYTTKPFMRNITPIKYEWVKELLKKLHQVNHRMLSVTGEIKTSAIIVPKRDHPEPAAPIAPRRNDEASIDAAKQRYLERKRARDAKKR